MLEWSEIREVILNSLCAPLPVNFWEDPQNIKVDHVWLGG